MPKERAQQLSQSSPPWAPASNYSPPPKEKSLYRIQKKFSLASGFPLSSPNRAHHYLQQQQQPRGALRTSSNAPLAEHGQPDHRIASSPLNIGSTAVVNRKGSVCGARKHSAPVDYRDSGVYLGEIGRDPVTDMWNTIREPDAISDRAEEESEGPMVSSAPVGLKGHLRRRYRRNVQNHVPPTLRASDSSKSLPAIDAILLSVDEDDAHQSTMCSRGVRKKCGVSFDSQRLDEEERLEHHVYDQFESCDLSERLSESDKPPRSARIKPQRNAQSFSQENLADRDEFFTASSPDSPDPSGRDRTSDAQGRATVRFDENAEAVPSKQKLVKKRSSVYTRSRSLAEDEATKRALEKEVRELEEAEKEAQASTGDRLRGRINLLRKGVPSNMVQVHTETESGVCDRKSMTPKKKRSLDPIAKKLTLTFLRRRPTGGSLPPAPAGGNAMNTTLHSNSNSSSPSASDHSPPKPPSREEVRKWAASFEHLLSHKYGVMLFRLFLQREFSEENIDFWTACEEYKKLRDAKLPSQARQIYNDFVAVQAPKEVNLDSVTRSSTMAALTNPNKRTFEQAQHRIQSLMEKDSYPRFLRSDLYLDVVRKC